MSKNEKVTEQSEEKVMTKYDLKKKRKEEQKKKDAKEAKIGLITGIVVVVALVALVVSFPIRSYISLNSAYIKIGGESVTKVEFDYNYNVVENNFMNNYGSYLSLMGIDTTQDITNQMYSDTMTWGNYFEQMTVESLQSVKALQAQAKADGFTYDTTEEYNDFVEAVKSSAAEQGLSVKQYLRNTFGEYATLKRLAPYIKNSIVSNAYYDKVQESKMPSDDEIVAYYEADTKMYDSADYYVTTFEAQLPTEPTELADEDAVVSEDTSYTPSEAEVAKAMEDAKALAEEAEATIMSEGTFRQAVRYSGTTNVIRDWLYEDGRVEGDTAVLEDTSANRYYVVGFGRRYLDETNTISANIIVVDSEEAGQDILTQWSSDKTQENFAALADEYNVNITNEGGYFDAITKDGTPDEVTEWLFDDARAEGDTNVISTEDGVIYVIYFKGLNKPQWMFEIRDTLVAEAMEAYIQEISAGFDVDDPKGNLDYLGIQAYVEAIENAMQESEDGESTEVEDEAATDATDSTEE